MEAASIAHAEHHGPPPAHQSSRVNAPTLGMMLFIISEVMIFGAFFTAYFFIRVVSHDPWPAPGTHLPEAVAGINTAILLSSSLTLHWALTSVKNGNRFGLKAGMAATFLLGVTFLSVQINEYIHIGFAPHDAAQGTIFYALTGLHGVPRVHRPVPAADGHDPRVPRPLLDRATPRHGGAGDLLALRRHHVGDRLHDGLRDLGRVPAAHRPCASAPQTRSVPRPTRSAF